MDSQRILLAVVLSLIILVGYQSFFAPPPPAPLPVAPQETTVPQSSPAALTNPIAPPVSEVEVQSGRQGMDIQVETSLFSAVISEIGGGIKSFKLKNYMETLDENSDLKQLVTTEAANELPLYFTWGLDEPLRSRVPVYRADQETVQTQNDNKTLSMTALLSSGVEITRNLVFHDDAYLMEMEVFIVNRTEHQIQGAPWIGLTNKPYSQRVEDRFLFNGPAVFNQEGLEEIKVSDLEKNGPKMISGQLSWVAYEGTYFMCAIIPPQGSSSTAHLAFLGNDKVANVLTDAATVLQPGESKRYSYKIFFGPKKLSTLAEIGFNLDKIVNFGWFDVMAKPVLHLLNFLYGYIHNYGLAIILVTIIIKILFWPITQKGMKSMKTMQKLQPKMTKLREKYSNNKERLNQEMVQLYKTYKVNPVGGCLPMILQIPVFFALYKVLLQTIELRHAPFMLWISDLAAPDRLPIGVDIPYLGGIPVLTLLMGGSMFLQQKMTPTTGDPTQAKIMMFLPVVFTFMFINFASGLVLYWFVNNLLSIAQQYAINRQVD